jgi:uncharacterized membrane protein (UPF0127 family)
MSGPVRSARAVGRWAWSAALAVTPALTIVPALAAVPSLAGFPPQFLPLTAQACFLRPAGVAPVCLQLEEPRNLRQYVMGMQLRPPLPALQGMWFAYASPTVARFWMHQTPEPLDMLFIRDGRVIAIVAAAAPCMRLPCRRYGPDQAVDGVLEIGAGEAARLGIGEGTVLNITALSPSAR